MLFEQVVATFLLELQTIELDLLHILSLIFQSNEYVVVSRIIRFLVLIQSVNYSILQSLPAYSGYLLSFNLYIYNLARFHIITEFKEVDFPLICHKEQFVHVSKIEKFYIKDK
jgi:hypothetical protein